MDGGRIVCIVLQAEPVTLVKRAHGRAAHCFRSSSCAHSAYLVVSVEAVFAVFCRLAIFQIQEKKVHTAATSVAQAIIHPYAGAR